jgi:NADH:ubiquinone reductase (H+-translocating)
MPNPKRVLILGGGYAGVSVAKKLEKKYRKRDDVEIVLVDKRPFHTLMTELHEVAGMRTDPESVQVSFKKIFGGRKVRVIVDRVAGVDFEAKEAILSSSRLSYDHIVFAYGAEPDFFGIPGVRENSFSLWSFEAAIEIRRHLEDIWARAAAESDPERRKRLLTFVVAGAGFTGIELAGELVELKKSMCRAHHIDPEEARVVVVEALSGILPVLDESRRSLAMKYLKRKGCEVLLDSPIVGAEEGLVKIKDGRSIECGTFIWTCGVSGSSFSATLGLESKRNRLIADEFLRVPGKDGAWAAGDGLMFLQNGKPVPQIVETAHQSGETVARNIAASIDSGELESFKPIYHGFMVSIGGKYGVANAGGIKSSGFFAMAMKHLINLYYLFTIAGINQCWEYLKHEFLDIHDQRSIIGGLAEHKMRGYWPVPIRLWLGFSWVMEGVNKIGEGWLDFAGGTKSAWMFSAGVAQAGISPDAITQASVDATASAAGTVVDAATNAASSAWAAQATGTVGATGTVADALSQASVAGAGGAEGAAQATESATRALGPVFDLTKSIFDSTGAVATWFRVTFMDGIFANVPFQAFQAMIVCAELGIGLALFGGAFTWFAAVASVGMCLVFTLSGMFRWDQLWFVFAAILCMGGAGRAFGLDYWIVRFAKRWWNGFSWVRKHHLYTGEPTK